MNANRARRSQSVKRFFDTPPYWVKTMVKTVIPKGGLRQRLRANASLVADKLNSSRVARPEMAPDLRRRLTEEFRPEVERLSALIDRDLSAWTAS